MKGLFTDLRFKEAVFKALIFFALVTLLMPVCNVYATETSADAMWSSVIDFITPWIQRAGGLTALVGMAMFGQSFLSDNPEGRTRGIQVVIGGAVIFAVGASSEIFLP